jgi:hypothetical protein
MENNTFTGWAIDRDYLADTGESNRLGYGQMQTEAEETCAASVLTMRISVRVDLKASLVADPIRFRLLDDDGEVYYGGAISREWLDGDEMLCFGPLNFGMADAGATEMQYKEGEDWKTL